LISIVSVVLQTFLLGLIGSAGGYTCGLKEAKSKLQPSASWLAKTCLISALCSSVLCVAFMQWLHSLHPLAPEYQPFMIELLAGFAIAKQLAKRYVKRHETSADDA
jgi:hypothetical protein